MSAFDTAISIGLAATRSVAGVEIVYRRGSTSLTFDAMKGKRQSELMSAGTQYSQFSQAQTELTDWILPVSALASLTPDEPAIEDEIQWSGRKYPLSAAEDGKCWRWMDPEQAWVRVHTVKGGAV